MSDKTNEYNANRMFEKLKYMRGIKQSNEKTKKNNVDNLKV